MAWSGNRARSELRQRSISGLGAAKPLGRRATVTMLPTARMMRESRRWRGTLRSRLTRTALALFGALLLTAVWAFAAPAAATSADANPRPMPTDLEARIVERLAPLMPPGVRIRKVEIP